MRSYFQPCARIFTPAIICRAVIVGPDLNLRRVPWFIAAILTVVPPTSTTSTFIASRSRSPSPAELILIIAGYASRRRSRSPVRQDDGASLDFAVVKKVVHLAGALQRKLLHQHLDLSRLG